MLSQTLSGSPVSTSGMHPHRGSRATERSARSESLLGISCEFTPIPLTLPPIRFVVLCSRPRSNRCGIPPTSAVMSCRASKSKRIHRNTNCQESWRLSEACAIFHLKTVGRSEGNLNRSNPNLLGIILVPLHWICTASLQSRQSSPKPRS